MPLPQAASASANLTVSGRVAAVGGAPALGSPDAAAKRPVGLAVTPSRKGYWVAAADGGVFSYGDAHFYGSAGGTHLNQPIVGIAATRSGHGYWLVAADGGVFSYGDAHFYGSAGGTHLNQPIVGIAATASGAGYWLAAADGGVFTYGDAAFHGSLAPQHPSLPVSSIVAAPDGAGYWLGDRDGSLHAYGSAGAVDGATATASAPMVAAGAASAGLWELAGTQPPPPPPATVSAASAGRPLGDFTVTCYDLNGTTATGNPVSTNVVAVDPSVIPLGSKITIDGVGERTALDTGGAIVGHRLDIWEPSYSACAAWGVQSRAVTLVA